MTQEILDDSDGLIVQKYESHISAMEGENRQLLDTLSLVNEKNRNLQDDIRHATSEIDVLKSTITELERQRIMRGEELQQRDRNCKAEIHRLEGIIQSQKEELSKYRQSTIRQYPNISTLSPIHPPFATHENVTPQYIIPPDPNHWSPQLAVTSPPFASKRATPRSRPSTGVVSSAPMTSRLESDLLQLNLERQEIESWLGRVHNSGKTIAEKKQKTEKIARLNRVESTISEIKAKLRQRKLDKQRPVG
jgi:chromosome segregation ATPase